MKIPTLDIKTEMQNKIKNEMENFSWVIVCTSQSYMLEKDESVPWKNAYARGASWDKDASAAFLSRIKMLSACLS